MVDLELLENKLIKWDENNAIKATDLHEWLGVKTQYNKWITRMLERDFEQGFDFVEQLETSTGGRSLKNYILTLDTAKEIAMLTRSKRGREVRKYFIMIEKKYIEMYKELLDKNVQKLLSTQKQLLELSQELNASALTYKGRLYTVTEIAKEYDMSARKLNTILRDLNVQHKDNGVWHVNSMYRNFVEYTIFNYNNESNSSSGISPCMKWTEAGKQFIDTILMVKGD